MSDGKQNDSSSDIMWLMFAVIAILLIIGWIWGKQLAFGYLYIKLIQLKIINFIFETAKFTEYIKIIETTPLNEWTMKGIMTVGGSVGYVVNVPLALIMGWVTHKIWSQNPLQKFKRILNMNSLKESEQRIWPYIAPVVHVNLIKESFSEGPYAMALKPYPFAVKYNLLTEEKNVNSLDTKKAEKLFISQLGKPYFSFDKLKKHEKALLCIMAANGCGDKAGAMAAINAIAKSSASRNDPKKMPDFSAAQPLYKYIDDPRVKEVIEKHAYVFTVMAQMLEFARGTGVFPSSYFVWLKTRDRVLWYTLNCVGRQVPFVEIAGIFGHWRAEQLAKQKLDMPFVEKAVEGLQIALREVKV